MFQNVRMINVHYRIYGSINNTTTRKIKKTKNLTNNSYFIMVARNVLVIQSNIVLKDVFSKIGLNCINLNVQDNNRKHVIQCSYLRCKELKQRHHLSRRQMMGVCLRQNNRRLNKFLLA